MIEIITDVPERVAAFRASGTVTAEDYERVLIPTIEERLRVHGRIRVLYQFGDDVTGISLGALWDDAKVGLAHLTAWERVAVVSDVEWLIGAARVFGFLIPCPVRTFPNLLLDEAKTWVSAEGDAS